MPQLDFANILTTSQIVWMGLIFLVLYWLLANWALPQVGAVLEDRERRIGADLDSARLAKAEADAAIAEVQESTRRARTEAQAAITSALNTAKAEAAEQAKAAGADLDQRLEDAERRIGQARTEAMKALRDVASETTGIIVARLTNQQANRKSVDAAVDGVLAERS